MFNQIGGKMKRLVKFSILFSTLLLGNSVFAQDQGEETVVQEKLILTVEDAVNYALTNSKSLKSAQIDLEMKKRANLVSWNTFIPDVSISGTMARTNVSTKYDTLKSNLKQMGITPEQMGYENNEINHWSAVGQLSVSWQLSLAQIDAIKSAKALYEQGKISWDQTVKQTEINIRKLFYGLLLQQENLKIQKDLMNNAKDRWNQAEINYKNGLVPELQVLNARVIYENKRPTILELEQNFKQNKETFALLLGLPYGKDFDISGEITVKPQKFDAAELYSKYLNNRLDVQNLKKNIELLKIQLEAKKLSSFTPAFILSWASQKTIADVDQGWFGDSRMGQPNMKEGGVLSLTLAMDLTNLLPMSANMQAMKDIKQNLAKAEIGLEQLKQNAEIEIHKLVDNIEKSKANITAMNNNVELAKKAYELTLKAYKSGTKELLDVRDSESSLSQAQLGLSNERFNYISALLDLEYAINESLTPKSVR